MKKLILPFTILLGCIILGGFIYASQIIKQKSIEKQLQVTIQAKENQNQIDLQTKCADMALKYFTSKGSKRSDGNNYENHYNAKLNKCFILTSYFDEKDDFLTIDLYDAAEGKHYAMYIGHRNCDDASLMLINDSKRCQFDSGGVWHDGNDTKNFDYVVGFRGRLNGGGMGNKNTLSQFMEAIKPFMND